MSADKQFVIGIAENTGNPESLMLVYFNKSKNSKVTYMDNKMLGMNLNEYNCLKTGIKTYFVSRDNQLGGFDKFFVKVKTIHNPYGINTIGIFTLKENSS